MDQACVPANTNPHRPTHSLQDHTAPHINPLSSSKQSTKGCGKTVARVPKQRGCTTKYVAHPKKRKRKKEDGGARLVSTSNTCLKRTVLNIHIFVRVEKPRKTSRNIKGKMSLNDIQTNIGAPQSIVSYDQ